MANHAELVWSSVNGSCVLKADNKTGEQIDELVAWHKAANYNVKAFAYPMDSEYASKSRPTTAAAYVPKRRKK